MPDSVLWQWNALSGQRKREGCRDSQRAREKREEGNEGEGWGWREKIDWKNQSAKARERQYNLYYKNTYDIMLFRNSSLPSHWPLQWNWNETQMVSRPGLAQPGNPGEAGSTTTVSRNSVNGPSQPHGQRPVQQRDAVSWTASQRLVPQKHLGAKNHHSSIVNQSWS